MGIVQYSILREQNVKFAVVVVEDHVITNRSAADRAVQGWTIHFGVPAVLVGARQHRTFGRRDLSQFVANNLAGIPWKKMAV